ncbi:hypothetical protein SDC9_205801 [bioreactor metagenome]|uniref:Uncharacterized protein n=1 Tax=bioreactor metagenome TaxID=1076179 RepID=A0A645J4N3_9ZZZZ
MTYLAMNHGIKGLAYFIYQPKKVREERVRKWGPEHINEETYAQLKTMHREIQELAPAYCLGKRIALDFQNDIDTAVIEHEGVLYVSCVNTKNAAVKGARIKLPDGILPDSEGELSFENGRRISLKQSTVEDDFCAYQVHIYKFILKKEAEERREK